MNNHSKISVRTLTAMALLIAMSIVFSWVLSCLLYTSPSPRD